MKLWNKHWKKLADAIVRTGSIKECLLVSAGIPEFDQGYGKETYEQRLRNKEHIILVAELDGKLVGFKAGYFEEHCFYSWMGGVVPAARRQNVARILAGEQEKRVKRMGGRTIRFKTLNKYKSMLIFALKNGFRIIGTTPFEGEEGFKIVLEKNLE